jgi:hypothetical protein
MKELFKLYSIDEYNIFILKLTEEKRTKMESVIGF